ncbi:MAG: glutaredoxin family protein [Gammaproteobacteria bacterium]|nr:glutaredoxin family protein [Gammaproteobacteria bacterium]
MEPLVFYTTQGCHLCEEAEELLRQLSVEHSLQWQSVDISTDPELFERYGIRIPVLRRKDTNAELGWPFDIPTLMEFL